MKLRKKSSLEVLRIFNCFLKQGNIEAMREAGVEILRRGEDIYPKSILITVKMQLDYSSLRKIHINEIYQQLSNSDKYLAHRLMPSLLKQSAFLDDTDNVDTFKSFNKYSNSITDLWMTDGLILNIQCSKDFNPSFFQISLSNLEYFQELDLEYQLAFEEGKKIIKVLLKNQFMPVFLTIPRYQDSGERINSTWEIITFPSIIRGGFYYCELVSSFPYCSLVDALHHFNRSILRLKNNHKITNIEYFDKNFNVSDLTLGFDWFQWIQQVQGISINSSKTIFHLKPITLQLYVNSYPSLGLIMLGCRKIKKFKEYQESVLIEVEDPNFLLAKRYSLVTDPQIQYINSMSMNEIPCFKSDDNNFQFESHDFAPVSISFNNLNKNYSMTKKEDHNIVIRQKNIDVKDFIVVINLDNYDQISARTFLLSLFDQKNINIIEIVIISSVEVESSILKLISLNFSLNAIQIANISELLHASDSIYSDCVVIFASQHLIFNYPDLLSSLTSYLSLNNIGTISCELKLMNLHQNYTEDIGRLNGLYPQQNLRVEDQVIKLSSCFVINSVVNLTYNVMASNFELMISRSRDVIKYTQDYCNSYSEFLINYSLDLFINNKKNIIVNGHSAYLQDNATPKIFSVDSYRSRVILQRLDHYKRRFSHQTTLQP